MTSEEPIRIPCGKKHERTKLTESTEEARRGSEGATLKNKLPTQAQGEIRENIKGGNTIKKMGRSEPKNRKKLTSGEL